MMDKIKGIIDGLGGTLLKGALKVDKYGYTNLAELSAAVRDFSPEQGWLCFVDEVILLDDLPVGSIESRNLISAELVNGEKSLHIRQHDNGWGGWIYTRSKDGNNLILEQTFLGTSKTNGLSLCYQTLWAEDKDIDSALQPTLSRFTGFVKGDN